MKNTFKTIAVAVLTLLAVGCTKEEFKTPSAKDVPVASELKPVIVIDDVTNYVTFSVENHGVVPVWIFGSELIDGKPGKKFCYTGNGTTLRIREAGEHSVELRAYNSAGMSVGSQIVTFSLKETYRDPFDPAPYMAAIANTWVWNSTVDGHFGCGESGTEGLNWWAAKAGEKADWSLYDDIITFDAEGNYTYDPVDGQVYVNKDSGFKNEFNTNDGNDYLAPIEKYTHKYTIENGWNEEGIEEIYLVLADGDNLSYIPNPEALTTPRYRFLETKRSEMKKNIQLVIDNGNIAWHYSFVPFVKTAGPEELLAGTSAEGKVWIFDNEAKGHLACGPDHGNPTGWWSANANEKDGFGVYDDEITFFPDGKYKFNPGEGGTIYVNKDVTVAGPGQGPGTGAAQGEDYQLAWTVQESTYTFDGETITLPEGIALGYMANNDAYTNPVYSVTAISKNSLTLVVDYAGISWQYIFKARDAQPDDNPDQPDEPESSFDINGPGNLWRAATITPEYWYSPGDWSGGINADAEIGANNNFTATIPEGVGGSEWMAQNKLHSGIATSADKLYDFCATFTASEDMTITVKLTGNPEGEGDPHAFFYEGAVQLEAGEPFTMKKVKISQKESNDDFTVIFDFGRSPIGSTITVTDICFQEHKEPAKTYYDIEGATNLYRSATITPEYWYSPGDWSGGINADAEIGANNDFTATIPAGVGGSEWMAQNKLHTGVATTNDKVYDFCCTLVADQDMTVTVKVTGNPEGEGDPHAFFYEGSIVLEADEPFTLQKEKISQRESNNDMTVIFDFGRSPIGSTINVTKICFQEHQEK